jgi:putative ABC transport system permease protein
MVLGSALGLVFAAATVTALGASAPMTVVVPWAWLVTVVLAGTGAGLLAGLLPARRAAHLPVLEAVTTT